MLTTNQVPETNIIEMKVDGEVETKDIEAARSEISSVLEGNGRLKVLVVYENLGSMGPKAIWEDTGLEKSVFDNAERLAVVSEKRWIESLAQDLGSSTSLEIETFETGQREEALRWLQA